MSKFYGRTQDRNFEYQEYCPKRECISIPLPGHSVRSWHEMAGKVRLDFFVILWVKSKFITGHEARRLYEKSTERNCYETYFSNTNYGQT
jgi:hypothetical protein